LAATWCWGADLEIVSFVEKDPYCQKVLNKNFKGVPIHDDITTYDGKTCGTVDLITGGFPCQPFSVAGKQKSKEDNRYLWPEMCRVISEARPAWVIGENVTGIVKLALDDVLADLDNLGYSCQPFIIPAAGVGARHRRDRIWIVANSKRIGRRGRNNENAQGQNWTLQTAGSCAADKSRLLADADKPETTRQRADGRKIYAESEPKGFNNNGRDWWTVEPELGLLANGIPSELDGYWDREPEGVPRVITGVSNRVNRLKCLGNAIVPQVVFPIMQGIKDLWRADE